MPMCSRIPRLVTAPHAPCDMIYFVRFAHWMLIGASEQTKQNKTKQNKITILCPNHLFFPTSSAARPQAALTVTTGPRRSRPASGSASRAGR